MKRKNSNTTDLRAFLARAATKKRQTEPESVNVTTSSNENQMQMVVFQWHSDSAFGTNTISEQSPIIVDKSMPHESECSNEDNNDDYDLEHDPGLRAPI